MCIGQLMFFSEGVVFCFRQCLTVPPLQHRVVLCTQFSQPLSRHTLPHQLPTRGAAKDPPRTLVAGNTRLETRHADLHLDHVVGKALDFTMKRGGLRENKGAPIPSPLAHSQGGDVCLLSICLLVFRRHLLSPCAACGVDP